MEKELKKSLTDLIDETLLELEELKKSNRFSAAEIEIKGPGADSLAGKPVNGKLGAEKAEDDDEEEPEDTEKGEGTNCEVEKKEDAEDKKDEDEPHKDDPNHEAKEKDIAKKLLDMHKSESAKEIADLKKSISDYDSLMKSYVEEKIAPLQTQLASILDAVTKLSNAPAPSKGLSYRDVMPLRKSTDSGEPLSKSEVANKLFELKKSGTRVDSADIARAEMGHDLEKIVTKYGIN